MPAPSTTEEFLDLVRKSGVVDDKRVGAFLDKLRAAAPALPEPQKTAGLMVRDAILTHFQAEQILQGKWRRFTIGKYKVLERLGSGGMGSVYLCEHKLMRRRVAVKVLPTAKADDPSSLERFYREARAVAALDHPNIVRAYDIDQDDRLHFLVMEYVDGASLQEIIKKAGPMDVLRAAHYMRHSAFGLQHAHETAGLVHRDVKPGNILIDRTGAVKILDMGLARFFHDEEDILTKKYDENVLGTADYLAPEQALDSHGVDIRADIYSLGATFYFCLTGRTPFTDGTIAQKLIWHQTRQPKPIRQLRPEVPEGLVAILDKMMAKDPAQRYQTPAEVASVLEPWTGTPIGPPPEDEMPRLSPAALGQTTADAGSSFAAPTFAAPPSSGSRKNWQVGSAGGARPAASPGSAPTKPPSQSGVKTPSTSPAPPRPVARPSPAPAPAPAARSGSPYRPAAAPQRAASAVAPAPRPAPKDGPPSWDQIAGDTARPDNKANTPPTSVRTFAGTLTQRLSATLAAGLSEHNRVWVVVAVVAAVLAGSLGLAAWLALGRDGGGVAPSEKSPARTFKVGKDAALKTVQDALKLVRPGDRIAVQGPEHFENLLVDGREDRLRNILLEPDDGAAPVIWKPSSRDPSQMIALSNVAGWRVQGFTFDGHDACRGSVLLLTGRCPGTVLDKVRVEGFRKVGVLFMNCEGDPDRPVSVARSSIRPVERETADAAFSFGIDPQMLTVKSNRHITLSDCRLDGAYQSRVQVRDPNNTRNVTLSGVTDAKGEAVSLPK